MEKIVTLDDASKTVKACEGWSSPYFYALDFDLYPPSVANLPAEMTIAGSTVYPTVRYNAKDLIPVTGVWPCWGYGANLGLGYVAPTYNTGSPLLGTCDDAVKFGANGCFAAASTTLADITTEDIVFEVVFYPPALTEVLVSKWIGGAGYEFLYSSGGLLYFRIAVVAGYTDTVSAAVSGWTHALFFGDRSGSGQWYVNGAASGAAVDISSRSGSLTVNQYYYIGARSDGSSKSSAYLAYTSLWKQSAWLDTHLQAAVAKERFARLCGLYPLVANGTYVPTTMARTSAGYLDKPESDGSRKLYYMGAGWPRVCKREDESANVVKGVLIEGERQNGILQASSFATTWSASHCSVSSDAVVAPDGTQTADILVEDSGSYYRWVRQSKDFGAVGITVSYSVFAKAVSRNYVGIYARACANGSAVFDLANGTCKQYLTRFDFIGIEDWGNGWYRCYAGGAVSLDDSWEFDVRTVATYDETLSAYDGTTDLQAVAVWQAQGEIGVLPSSPIPTTTGAVTRYADSLVYNGNNWPQSKGRVTVESLIGTASSTNQNFVQADDGSADNRHVIYSYATSGEGSARVFVGGVSQADIACASVLDGDKHLYEYRYKTNRVDFLLDGTPGTPDTSCTMPSGITNLRVGGASAAGSEAKGLIAKLRIDT